MAATTDKKTKTLPDAGEPTRRPFARYCLVLLLSGVVVLAWVALLTYSPADPPSARVHYVYPPKASVDNHVGIVGAYVAHTLRYWLGGGAHVGLLLLSIAAGRMLLGGRIKDWPWRLAGAAVLVTATASAYSMGASGVGVDVAEGMTGILGLGVGRFVLERFSGLGSCVILTIAFCIGVMLTADQLVLRLLRGGWRVLTGRERRAEVAAMLRRGLPRGASSRGDESPARPIRVAAAAKPTRDPDEKRPARAAPAEPPAERLRPMPLPAPPVTLTPAKSSGPRPDAKGKKDPGKKVAQPVAADKADYELPPVDLLETPTGKYNEAAEVQAMRRRLILQQTLDDFNVAAEVVGFETGPVITLFELSLSPGVKTSGIASLATDIARSLAVPGVRVVPPRFGKDTVGIEVPNLDKEIVRIRELMDLAPDAEKAMHLPLYLGKDAGGDPIIADLAGMPHMLIAGTTGSGKSVCINAILMSILMLRTPEDVRLILVDPKMVEMAAFEEIPHLLCPIINDMRKAEDILEWAVTKMNERYELLKETRVKNIAAFNALGEDEVHRRLGVEEEQEKARVPGSMPYYVIIIDELADLIMTSDKEVEGYIIRIAQKARAVGIHLILATQRPSANVVTGLIKSNMPCRISFRVASRQESRIVLDQNGAEVLLGKGDMLFLQPGASTLIRAQGTFLEDGEIRGVVKTVRKTGRPDYNAELVRLNATPSGDGGGERDDLFDKAAEIVLTSQRGSVSLLQRRLQVGYTRASRIIDQMAEAGLLGDFKGSQARECMMTLDDWRQLQESIAADQSGDSALNGEPTSV